MNRIWLALALGAAVTLLPYLLRPFIGEQAAIFWLPGFVAISHWFPRGLHSPESGMVKLLACTVNVPLWAGAFLLFSALAHFSLRLHGADGRKQNNE